MKQRWLFIKINDIDKPLAKLTRRKKGHKLLKLEKKAGYSSKYQ
jgi:hypothetical protein